MFVAVNDPAWAVWIRFPKTAPRDFPPLVFHQRASALGHRHSENEQLHHSVQFYIAIQQREVQRSCTMSPLLDEGHAEAVRFSCAEPTPPDPRRERDSATFTPGDTPGAYMPCMARNELAMHSAGVRPPAGLRRGRPKLRGRRSDVAHPMALPHRGRRNRHRSTARRRRAPRRGARHGSILLPCSRWVTTVALYVHPLSDSDLMLAPICVPKAGSI